MRLPQLISAPITPVTTLLCGFLIPSAQGASALPTNYVLFGTRPGVIDTIDPGLMAVTASFPVGIFQALNGLACDIPHNRVYFNAVSGPERGNLYFWDRNDNSVQLVQSDLALPGMNNNAAVYADSYWYIAEGTDSLYQVDLANPNHIQEYADFDTTGRTFFSFGDIAITDNGLLYGVARAANGANTFFQVDLTGGTPHNYQEMPFAAGMQIALDAEQKTLYGQTSNGQWYTINPTTGIATQIFNFITPAYSDLAGVAPEAIRIITVPEPSSVVSLAVGLVMVAWVACRPRRRQ